MMVINGQISENIWDEEEQKIQGLSHQSSENVSKSQPSNS